MQEKREQRRKERRERQLEKEAETKRNREEANEGGKEEEDETSEKIDDREGRERKTNESEDPIFAQQKSDDCDKTSYLADREIETKTSKQEEKKDGEAEEGQEREADNEEEDEPSRSSSKVKKRKSDKKKDKESSKKPEEDLDVEKKKDRSKKSKKKKKGNQGQSELLLCEHQNLDLSSSFHSYLFGVLSSSDGSGLRLPSAYEPEPIAQYGTLDVAFEYDSSEQWLAVTVTAATDIPALKQTGNIAWQVHLVLLPTKKQRAKTGVQKGPCPVFTETFRFSRVEQEALGDYAVRFRLYSIRRMKKEKVLGEKVFYLTKLNLQGKIALPVTLEPGSELTVRTSYSSLPEILLGLIYNVATGQLSAEVIQGSHFKTAASDKPVNTYVKLTMLDSKGKEMSKRKTAVCRGQPNPTYKETFVFQVALFQLSEVSLVVSVFCRRSSMRPRERLGWVSLGHSSTTEEQQSHWTEMREAEGQQVCHWHTLTDT
uniref:Synaptotagmin XIVb n=1 Tax=Xiphophorus couchianus TaxID=32473 RepID=A0A3B5KVX4_9TELE